jgi:hypothetical protein
MPPIRAAKGLLAVALAVAAVGAAAPPVVAVAAAEGGGRKGLLLLPAVAAVGAEEEEEEEAQGLGRAAVLGRALGVFVAVEEVEEVEVLCASRPADMASIMGSWFWGFGFVCF